MGKITRQLKLDMPVRERLVALAQSLDGLPPSSETRALRVRLSSFEQAVKRWAAVPPSDAQRDALHDLLDELHDRIRAEQRKLRRSTFRPRNRAASAGPVTRREGARKRS